MREVQSTFPPGFVGIISGDLARFSRFTASMLKLWIPEFTSWNYVFGNGFAANRNTLLRGMIESEKPGEKNEWVWFMDDDHVFDPRTLMRLLTRDVPIIQPLISTRKPPFYPYAYQRIEGQKYRSLEWDELPLKGIHRVDGVGAGGMLVKREVLDAVGDPWFEEGKTAPDCPGEDLFFCSKAAALGYDSYVDLDVRLGHLTVNEVWPDQHDGKWFVGLDLGHGPVARLPGDFGKLHLQEAP